MPTRFPIDRLVARATFGARPGDRERARLLGPEAWVDAQLAAATRPDLELDRRLEKFPSRELTPESFGEEFGDLRGMRRRDAEDPELRRRRKAIAGRAKQVSFEAAGLRFVRAVHGENGLFEVMVDFWSNHFSLFARKGFVAGLVPQFQREVIEKHALGRFEDLLLATAQSPAMLVYLDNWTSTAPRRLARLHMKRAGRGKGGINENYARELLELHTLGVDGGYTQRDVVEVARVLTGWTLDSRRRPTFRFRRPLHDGADKTVLGARIRGAGIEEGEQLLVRLARHPSTARHIATKLARRFVSDRPPAALVERVARRFLESGGDIPSVLRALLLSPEFADEKHRKLKTPLRFLASAVRESGGETDGGKPTLVALARLGEVPLFARTPAGYPEAAQSWADPGAALERMGVAFALALGQIRGTTLGAAESRGEAVALTLAAPEFQWT